MNAFLDKLERRFGHLAIEDLTKKLVILKVIVFICIQFVFEGDPKQYTEALSNLKIANTYIIGDLIASLCTPTVLTMNGLNLIWLYFAMMIFLMAGRGLESVWGKFRYNLYIIAYTLVYIALYTIARALFKGSFPVSPIDFLYVGIFLAFATKFPDVELMLFFIIPAKMKYLGWIAGAYVAFLAFGQPHPMVSAIAAIPLIHYAIFVIPYLYGDASLRKRRKEFQKNVDPNQGRPTFHQCAECGITENDDKDMIFRVGEDGKDYCEEHIDNH